MRHYTHSYPLPAVSSLGKEYIVAGGIISTHDNNLVLIDSNFDGIFEDKAALNAGGEHNSGDNWQVIGHVKGEYPVLVRFILLSIWSGTNEFTMARIVYPSGE